MFNLEDNLPDELVQSVSSVSSGSNWSDNLGGNKTAGPPGNNQPQMNGDDPTVVPAWNQHQRPGWLFFHIRFC